jgi:hypothetical protein
MRCYHTYDPLYHNKVLIPQCWQVLFSNDISDCTCSELPLTEKEFEKDSYNKKVSVLNAEISELREMVEILKGDNNRLMKMLNIKEKQ